MYSDAKSRKDADKDKYGQANLERIKKDIQSAFDYYAPNYNLHSKFRKFIYETTLDDNDKQFADSLNRPHVQFNIGEAYLSRQVGEFSKQEPSIVVSSADVNNPAPPELLEFVEGYIRYIIDEANNQSFETNVYAEMLSGGFTSSHLYTEYKNPMSFEQDIKIKKCRDALLVAYDPMAEEPNKGDGNYCVEFIPMTKEKFEQDYPEVDISMLNFGGQSDKFSWSYQAGKEKIVLVCDYYEKKREKVKIVYLSNHKVLRLKQYKEYMKQWEAAGHIEAPAQILEQRETEIVTICRTRLVGSKILKYEETDDLYFPFFYAGGNTQKLMDFSSRKVKELARPYLYHAYDAQRMKNLGGQSLINWVENLVMHKFKVAKESIPEEQGYQEAYKNMQVANTFVYNAFLDWDPAKQETPIPIPPPQEIQNPPMPQEIMQCFEVADKTMQAIIGSYDAALGINENQLSGVAIIEGATQSNATGMPYVISFLQMLGQIARAIVAKIPQVHVTNIPRVLPYIDRDGKKREMQVNKKDGTGIQLDYDPNSLHVRVEAGVNFTIQKNRALQQIIMLSKASPTFAQFFAEAGMPVILDNIEIRGIERIKKLYEQWQQQQQQQKQQMLQMQMQTNPQLIRAMTERQKVQAGIENQTHETALKQVDLMIKERGQRSKEKEVHNDTLRTLTEIAAAKEQMAIEREHLQTERDDHILDFAKAMTESESEAHERNHRHLLDTINVAHELIKTQNAAKSE